MDEDLEQIMVDLKYLKHMLLNGTCKIQGCMKEIETIVREMSEAVKACREALEVRDGWSDKLKEEDYG